MRNAPIPLAFLTASALFAATALAQSPVNTRDARVAELEEKTFRTRAPLLLLQETVLGGDASQSARVVVFHQNEMSASFVLESVEYALDGAPVFTRVDAQGALDRRAELEIFNGRIAPGEHQLAVRLVYRPHADDVFTYVEGYKFKVQSSHTFSAEAGKVTSVKVAGFEKDGLVSELKDRPAVRYDIEVSKDAGMKQPAPAQADATTP